MSKEAMRSGLVALKTLLSRDPCVHANTAIQMIDAMLAEQPRAEGTLAQQSAERGEPMAWIERDMNCDDFDPDSVTCQKPDISSAGWEWVPLYTAPQAQPAREWVGLTEEEKTELRREHYPLPLLLMEATEAKLKEKNT